MRSAVLVLSLLTLPFLAWPQEYSKSDRDLVQGMLRDVAADVKKNYYDAKLHGVDWDAKVHQTKGNIDKADSLNAAISEVAALLDTLNDSHTSFIPPPRPYVDDYGFEMQMIGERCFVTRVHPESDAVKKGLKVGDQILAVNEHPVSRTALPRIRFIYETLRPQPGLVLTLADGNGGQRKVEIITKFRNSGVIKYALHFGINKRAQDIDKERHILRARYYEKGDGLLVIKIPEFAFSALEVDNILGKMRKHTGVVLDLRGNPGGFEATLDRLVGGLFEYDLNIFDRVGRNSSEVVTARGRHHEAYTGRFVVLIDSDSASASELFARVIQLEKRGFVMGDHSSGSVMEAKVIPHELTLDSEVFYGASITTADLLMADGKSLEHVGVEPDVVILPTPKDLASGRDPAMAKAAGLVGAKVTPEEAGTMFPPEDANIH